MTDSADSGWFLFNVHKSDSSESIKELASWESTLFLIKQTFAIFKSECRTDIRFANFFLFPGKGLAISNT